MVVEVADNLEHEVHAPDSVHADRHEDHKAEGDDKSEDHGVGGAASDGVDGAEL
mgnify:CR=1 FL=1